MTDPDRTIAYLAMEVALANDIHTYAGGLGILAGDTLRSAADLDLPVVAVSLVYRKGFFRQLLDADGRQREEPAPWPVEDRLEPTGATCAVEVEGRRVALRAWRYTIKGRGGGHVPLYLLDSDVNGNDPYDRTLTDRLYGGDYRHRLCQEVVLGLGGFRILRALGYNPRRFHLNEGHAALLLLELLAEARFYAGTDEEAARLVRRRCAYTTHTPVAAGHDCFGADLAAPVLGPDRWHDVAVLVPNRTELNMTHLALHGCGYCNGVARRHGEVSRELFPGFDIDAITNGVHTETWAAPSSARLFDRYVEGWRDDPSTLRNALGIPADELVAAHREARALLVATVGDRTGVRLDPDTFTVGFARRATPYKRLDLLFSDPSRLRRIGETLGPIQIVLAGKAHPADEGGKSLIRKVFSDCASLGDAVSVVYVPGHDMDLGRRLTAGVDVWLNTPRPPREASGTSGMKAALNGVPNLSILDGWWVEGHIEGVTGWAVGRGDPAPTDDPTAHDAADADDLYRKLEQVVLPLYRDDPAGWATVMRNAIALNGSWFHTHRMVHEYAVRAWMR